MNQETLRNKQVARGWMEGISREKIGKVLGLD